MKIVFMKMVNLKVIRPCADLHSSHCPVCVGFSRKQKAEFNALVFSLAYECVIMALICLINPHQNVQKYKRNSLHV